MASIHKSLDQGLDSESDCENQLIIVCKHCSLTTTQIIGTRRRTICPHCGNFYSGDAGPEFSVLSIYQTRSINSCNRMMQSLPSISKNNKPGPLRSITNFFKRIGSRERPRKSNGTQKSNASCDNPDKSRLSNLSRLNSSSHTQLPPIVQNPPFETLSVSPKIQANEKTSKDEVLGASKRCLKSILNRRIEELENDVELAKESGDWGSVKEFYAAIFDNFTNLNAAFKVEGKKKETDAELDCERIYAAFDILKSTPAEVQKISLKAIIGNLFRDRRIQNKEEIRAYAVTLLNPQFDNPSTYTIFAHLLRQISILKDHQHHYLVQWFKNISSAQFKEKIHRIQKFITMRLSSPKHEDLPPMNKCLWWLSSATKVLALLYASSNLSVPPIVSYQEFYNPSLEQLDLLAEYFNWQSSKGSTNFSFCQYPFILTLTAKRTILQKDSEQQMVVMARKSLFAKVQQHQLPEIGMLFLTLTVRRSHLVSDSLNEIARKQTELKKKLKVTFAGEPGLDMGGLTKEWFLLLTRQIFQPEFGMFTYDKSAKVFWFSSAPCDNFQEFNLVGVLMGLAVYNSIILDIRFPPICYKKILSPPVVPNNIQKAVVGITKVGLEDLKSVHPEIAKGLQELLDYDGDVEDDVGVTFQITYDELGTPVTHELKQNGQNIPVTNLNREEYVQLYVDFILNQSIYRQFQAFYHGFHSVCASNALILLRPEEIELLVCGNPSLDMNELKNVTIYDGYTAESDTIKYFWEVVMSLPISMQKKLLLFATGSDRVPISGMSEMQFKVTRVENVNMLPVSQTCFNQLVLPAYNSKKLLKQKLLVAIQNAEGFGLE